MELVQKIQICEDIIDVLRKHYKEGPIFTAGCWCLSLLTMYSEGCRKLTSLGVVSILTNGLDYHIDSLDYLKDYNYDLHLLLDECPKSSLPINDNNIIGFRETFFLMKFLLFLSILDFSPFNRLILYYFTIRIFWHL